MLKISLIKWLIHFFGFKKSAVDATCASVELPKLTAKSYEAIENLLELSTTVVGSAARSANSYLEGVYQRQRESAEENMRRFRADLKRESKEFDFDAREKYMALLDLEEEQKKNPRFAEANAWLKNVGKK